MDLALAILAQKHFTMISILTQLLQSYLFFLMAPQSIAKFARNVRGQIHVARVYSGLRQ